MIKLAGRRHMRMAAQIRHVGRRSAGHTSLCRARLTGDTFVIPLTFGNQSDWSRNVRRGGCEIRLDGAEYRADRPQFVDGPEARAVVRQAFGPAERAMFRVLGIRQYLLLRRAAS